MNKIGWLFCICIFIFVTAFVVSVDSSGLKRVKFTNQNFELKNESNEVVNDPNSRKITLTGSHINNQNIDTYNQNVDYENRNNYGNSRIKINHSDSDYEYQNTQYSDSGRINHRNLDDSGLDAAIDRAKYKASQRDYGEFNYKYKNQKIPVLPTEEYEYQSIDWSMWKSNFVNKILDDSLDIKELDNYPNNSWFYYSFIVDDQGKISNISVKSVYLNQQDKQKIARFIKGYEGSYLTKFPENSKRKTAKISAIMMLSSEETKHSKPSDFRDMEQVKYKVR